MKRDLDRLVRGHEPFVRALALKLAPAPGLAGDVAQQVFLEFIEKAGQWDLSGDLRPLLATMTRNVARRCWRDRLRDMSPQMKSLAEHIQRLADAEEVPELSEERKKALRTCLEKLPEKSRHLVKVHYDLGVSSVDIAEQMQMSADAVRRALFRLRWQLKRCVEGATYA